MSLATPSAALDLAGQPLNSSGAATDDLPPALVAALERDLNLTPEQYLDLATEASAVADAVSAASLVGEQPLEVRLEGGQATVIVADRSHARYWQVRGFETVVGAPAARAPEPVALRPADDLRGGDMVTFDNASRRCSVAANGTSLAGEQQVLTAGHCAYGLSPVDVYQFRPIAAPGRSPLAGPPQIVGYKVPGKTLLGGPGYDAALVSLVGDAVFPTAFVTAYGFEQAAPESTAPLPIRDVRAVDLFPIGSPVCKSGATTGWTCGELGPLKDQQLIGSPGCVISSSSCYFADGFFSSACALSGDSGGPVLIGTTLVGVVSATSFDYRDVDGSQAQTAEQACAEQRGTGVSFFFAMEYSGGVQPAGLSSVATAYGAAWEPTVWVELPEIESPSPGASAAEPSVTLSGRVPSASPRTVVDIRVGPANRYETSVDDTTGEWALAIPEGAFSEGRRDLWITARWGNRSSSSPVRVVAGRDGIWNAPEVFPERFRDVSIITPFYLEIAWLSGTRVSTGYDDRTFRPVVPVARDAMAAFLYRFAGSPAFSPPADSPFIDVPPESQFYREITWLASTGITTGYPDRTFRPLAPVARDAMAAFLYRFAERAGSHAGFPPPRSSAFVDVQTNSQFYREIAWLAASGITTGYADGSFRPLASVNRDAMAAFLYRYDRAFR